MKGELALNQIVQVHAPLARSRKWKGKAARATEINHPMTNCWKNERREREGEREREREREKENIPGESSAVVKALLRDMCYSWNRDSVLPTRAHTKRACDQPVRLLTALANPSEMSRSTHRCVF